MELKQKINVNHLVEILDKYGLEGEFDGGNDSGGIQRFELSGLENQLGTLYQIRTSETYTLLFTASDGTVIDLVKFRHELLNFVTTATLEEHFFSWAGNFSANGGIFYDKEERQIVVEVSEYNEERTHTVRSYEFYLKEFFEEKDLKRVDSVNISVNDWERPQVRINVVNGAWTESLDEAERKILHKLREIAEALDGGEKIYLDRNFPLDEETYIAVEVGTETSHTWRIQLKPGEGEGSYDIVARSEQVPWENEEEEEEPCF